MNARISDPCVTSLGFVAVGRRLIASLVVVMACGFTLAGQRFREVSALLAAEPFERGNELPWSNAGFETRGVRDDQPAGWHSLRQARRAPRTDRDGHCLYFFNEIPGRESQAQRTIKIGDDIQAVVVSANVRLAGVSPGQTAHQRPQVFVAFENRTGERLSTATLGLWMGTSDWTVHEIVVDVPSGAHAVSVWIGLAGGVGEAWFDDVDLRKTELNRSVLPAE